MRINKELLKGTTSLLVLQVISERDMYGYQIIQELQSRSGAVFSFKEGTLYPILHALEKAGALSSYSGESETGRERRYYRITAAGKIQLAARLEEWGIFSDAVDGILGKEV